MEAFPILARAREILPVRPLGGALLLRAATLWVVVRVIFAIQDYRLTHTLSRPSLAALFGIVLVTVALGLLDVRRRGEHVLLANLGVGQAALGALMLVPPVLLEILMALANPL